LGRVRVGLTIKIFFEAYINDVIKENNRCPNEHESVVDEGA
jgi:hypothetical protein